MCLFTVQWLSQCCTKADFWTGHRSDYRLDFDIVKHHLSVFFKHSLPYLLIRLVKNWWSMAEAGSSSLGFSRCRNSGRELGKYVCVWVRCWGGEQAIQTGLKKHAIIISYKLVRNKLKLQGLKYNNKYVSLSLFESWQSQRNSVTFSLPLFYLSS